MEKLKILLLSIIFVAALFATVFCILGVGVVFFSGKENYISETILFTVLALICGLFAFYIKQKKTNLKHYEIENTALKIATANDGLITAAELAMNSSIGLKEASVFLENCYSNDLCEKKYTEESLVEVFYFKSAMTLATKRTSKSVSKFLE